MWTVSFSSSLLLSLLLIFLPPPYSFLSSRVVASELTISPSFLLASTPSGLLLIFCCSCSYEALVNTESFCFMDEGLDRLVPDLNWKQSFIDRLARRERYLDPTLGPAGAPMMLEPLE